MFPSLVDFLSRHSKSSTGFITELPTQWIYLRPSFKTNLIEYIQNVVFLVSHLSWTTYSTFFHWSWNFQYFQWSHATFNWTFSLNSYSCSLLVDLVLFVVGLGLHMLLRYHSPPKLVKSVWRFLLKSSEYELIFQYKCFKELFRIILIFTITQRKNCLPSNWAKCIWI